MGASRVALLVAVAGVAGCAQQSDPATTTSRVSPAARQLTAELAVFRRPQTAQDRTLPGRFSPATGSAIIPSLTRLVATGNRGKPGRFRIYLAVSALQPCGPSGPGPTGGDGVSLITVFSNGTRSYTMGFTAGELERSALIPTGPGPGGGLSLLASVVPDGVVRVTWTVRTSLYGAQHVRLVSVSPGIHSSVAVALFAGAVDPLTAIWHFADGRTTSSQNAGAYSPECRNPSVILGAHNPIASWLNQHFAIFRTSRFTHPLAEPGGTLADYFRERGFGLNFAQARFVVTGTGLLGAKPGVWVVPGSSGVCVLDALQNGVCGPRSGYRDVHTRHCAPYCGSASPESGGFRVSSRDNHGDNMYSGLVPDGNRTVSIVLADGAARTISVLDNVYSLTVKGRAVALIDKDSAGHREQFTPYANDNQF